MAPSRRRFLQLAGVMTTASTAGCSGGSLTGGDRRPTGTGTPSVTGTATPTPYDHEVVSVPADVATIQDAVDAATPGDLVLVAPGTYDGAVSVSTPNLTIRGRDRNGVVLDGGFERRNGIEVHADGVALENLTARHYRGTGFYWSGVTGFRGSFLTAHTDGYYGIYAYGSRDGRFEHSYASGHPDAGVYLGRHRPYEATVTDVVAEHNAIGYSGTSTGPELTVTDSVWRHNKVGIFPNTLDRADPPQRASRIVDNEVYANNDPDAPALDAYPLVGMGILLWGGTDNVVSRNRVHDHDHFGIVAQPHVVEPSGNAIRDNTVEGSGRADLALGHPAGPGNDFRTNTFGTSLPPAIESDASAGSEAVADVFARLERQGERGEFPAGDWREQPAPGDQPTMPDPEAPPKPATRDASWDAPQPQTDGYELG